MKKVRVYLLLIICFSLVFFMIPSNFVYAENNGSLSVTLKYGEKPISGVEFTIYRVADLKEDKSGYTEVAPFKWGSDFSEIRTADGQLKLAFQLEKQSYNAKAIMSMQTNEMGVVHFARLKNGIYLVVQTGATGEAENYTTMLPFLVMVPRFENGIWNYNVNTKPKPAIKREEKPKVPPKVPPSEKPRKKTYGELPRTGDATDMFLGSGILLIGGGILILLKKRKE